MTSAAKTRVALVGLGSAGLVHLQSVVQLPHTVQLSWVVDIDESKAQRIAAEHGCRWSTDLGEALADVDAVIIASSTDTRFPCIMESLRANKAVLTENPISHKLHEVVEAVELAKRRNLAFVCGCQRRADRHFRTLKQQLDAGAVGKMKLVKTCSRDNPLPPLEYLRTSGGIFRDMLIHDFDMLDLLSNGEEPESVTAIGHCYNSEIQEMNDIDTCAVMFKYASGTMAMVDASRDASYGCDQRIEVFGENGMLTARSELTSTVELATSAGHLRPPAMYSSSQPYLQAYRSELTEFLELVRAGSDSEAQAKEQVAMLRHPRVVRATLAAELSWKLGRTVQLAELEAKSRFGDSFRNCGNSERQEKVAATYGSMQQNQTVEFVREQREEWRKSDKGDCTVMEPISMLDDFDPDVDTPKSIHDFPNPCSGDTLPVGCAPAEDTVVFLLDQVQISADAQNLPVLLSGNAADLKSHEDAGMQARQDENDRLVVKYEAGTALAAAFAVRAKLRASNRTAVILLPLLPASFWAFAAGDQVKGNT
ncbi:iolG [Symbiodinium sp. CCMP2592]|nr:iolG [Symbiodinium sp. CCMP2592]